jgi:hypothetical protein
LICGGIAILTAGFARQFLCRIQPAEATAEK